MYIITNRKIRGKKGSVKMFRKTLNPAGANELRLLKMIDRKNKKFELLEDKLSLETVKKLKEKYNLSIDETKTQYASLAVACDIFEDARSNSKQVLVFTHGYNNDMDDITTTALKLEKVYPNTIVVIFSWPANGGGVLTGTANYLGDKKDALSSTEALNNFFEKLYTYHKLLSKGENENLIAKFRKDSRINPENAKVEYVNEIRAKCKTTINLLCHSMGNYVLKYATKPSTRALNKPIFDNVCLVAADTNNKEHREWVEKIETKNRVYIVINENDSALKWSRIKPGEEQLARLGHYTRLLNAKNATYIDVTNAKNIGTDHSYFKDTPVKKNIQLQKLFLDMFHGEVAENSLVYRASTNTYVIE